MIFSEQMFGAEFHEVFIFIVACNMRDDHKKLGIERDGKEKCFALLRRLKTARIVGMIFFFIFICTCAW